MNTMEIKNIIQRQRSYFESGATLGVKFRRASLRALYERIKSGEREICDALKEDLGKSSYESYMCEIGQVLSEIRYMIKNVGRFAKKKRVRTPISQFPGECYELSVPYGNTLIISPWNYPFLLSFLPLADALAAGNTVILKPSAYSPATSALVGKIISELFPEEYVAVVEGGRAENSALLDEKFDFIFFTGSTAVGREVLRRAAQNLTPAVLELGGKSPCIVDKSAKVEIAAKRIVFGKYLNCGQTCVAPDYILCHSSAKERLILELKKQIVLQYGERPLENADYGRIVNEKHFDRLLGLMEGERVIFGGESSRESLKIAPAIIECKDGCGEIMKEEIFGPLLPIITFDNDEEIYSYLSDKPKPLALYLFSENKKQVKDMTERLRFGGGCINDCVCHVCSEELAFGGVGESGMGAYHGKAGFDAFSHKKSIVTKMSAGLEPGARYQPYKKGFGEKLLHFFLK